MTVDRWAGPTQYVIDGEDVISTDAYRVNLETGEYRSFTFDAEDKVELTDDVPDGFEFVGVAAAKEYDQETGEWHDPDTVLCVFSNDDGSEWGAVALSEAPNAE